MQFQKLSSFEMGHFLVFVWSDKGVPFQDAPIIYGPSVVNFGIISICLGLQPFNSSENEEKRQSTFPLIGFIEVPVAPQDAM